MLTYLGQQTIGIYVIHQGVLCYLVNIIGSINISYVIMIVILTTITLVISQCINIVLQKYKLTAFIFLGKS